MRLLRWAGVLLLAAGLLILLRPPTWSREESVFRAGNIEARMEERYSVPPWIGGAALGAGAVLVAFALRGRS